MNFIVQKHKYLDNENKKKIEKKNTIIEEYKEVIHYYSLHKVFELKPYYNNIIPLHLYTCWHTKELPQRMQENYNYLMESNPKITFHLYDEHDCRQFIQEHFEQDVIDAYNHLIPCSYKSDLWRFCILYIYGGIYMDIKYRCVNNFKFIALTEEEHFVKDVHEPCIYTALIVTLPKNEIMKQCISQIVENVKNKYYGANPLYPTGPGLLGQYFTPSERESLSMYHKNSVVKNKINEYYIVQKNGIILKCYPGYREDQTMFQKNKHYHELWHEQNIYL